MTVTSPFHQELANHALVTHWYAETAMGRRLAEQFDRFLSQALEQVFGYQMLVTGAETGLNFGRIVKTQRVFLMASRSLTEAAKPGIIGCTSELPFASDSIDALILSHTLDASPVPHNVLRECRRVLVPNGHLFVMGFSPYSLWGFGNWARNRFLRRRQGIRAIGSRQLRDWLSLLDFSYAEPLFMSTMTPSGEGRLSNLVDKVDRWLVRHNAPTGSAYLIHARKRVAHYLDIPTPAMNRSRLIAMPLGKTAGGVSVPRQSRDMAAPVCGERLP